MAGYERGGPAGPDKSEAEYSDEERARRDALRPEETPGHWDLREGMTVLGSDGGLIGKIKEVRPTDFLVDRTLAADYFVPYAACAAADGDQVTLKISAGEIDKQGWASPGRTETPFV